MSDRVILACLLEHFRMIMPYLVQLGLEYGSYYHLLKQKKWNTRNSIMIVYVMEFSTRIIFALSLVALTKETTPLVDRWRIYCPILYSCDLFHDWSIFELNRYKIYIEGRAWSVSEKYIISCDSMTLYVKPKYFDFFIRGMVPLEHFWPINDQSKCHSLKFAVEWGNNHTNQVLLRFFFSFFIS